MSRIARVVVPGFPHHVTQRGNRGAGIFQRCGLRGLPRPHRRRRQEGGNRSLGLVPDAQSCSHRRRTRAPTSTAATPATSTPARAAPAISGNPACVRWPWTRTRSIWRRLSPTSSTIRFALGWPPAARSGAGRVPGPISRARRTAHHHRSHARALPRLRGLSRWPIRLGRCGRPAQKSRALRPAPWRRGLHRHPRSRHFQTQDPPQTRTTPAGRENTRRIK